MAEVFFRYFRVGDLFEILRGHSKYIARYYAEHPGPYPVYSASTDEHHAYGFVDAFDFDGDFITWTTNGYAGHAFVRRGKFCATRDVGVLRPNNEFASSISLEFFAPLLTRALQDAAVGRRRESGESDYTKIASRSAAVIEIIVPVNRHGRPHLAFQQKLAQKYGALDTTRGRLGSLLTDFRRKRIAFEQAATRTRLFPIVDLFELTKGDGALTQRYIRDHPGPYPVFSGSSLRHETAGSIDHHDFDGGYLTWTADGYAGQVFARRGKFSANSHAGILKPRAKFAAHLHLPYFEHALTPVLESIAVGRFRDDGSPDYTRVTVAMVRSASVELPICNDGKPDIEAQRRLVMRIALLKREKRRIEDALHRLANADVVVDWQAELPAWSTARRAA